MGGETEANCPQPELHLSWESLYYSPRAVNHAVEDTARQFHQAPLKAGGSESNLQQAFAEKSIQHRKGSNDLVQLCQFRKEKAHNEEIKRAEVCSAGSWVMYQRTHGLTVNVFIRNFMVDP